MKITVKNQIDPFRRRLAILIVCAAGLSCAPRAPHFRGPGHDAFWPIEANDSKAYGEYLRGKRLSQVGEVDAAIEAFQRSLAAGADSSVLYTELAREYVRRGDLNRGEEMARKAVGTDPKSIEAYYLLGKIHAARQEWEPSEVALRKVVELDEEGEGDGAIALASVYVESKRPEKAVSILKELLEKNPSNLFGHYYLGRVYSEMNRMDDALASYGRALEIHSGFTSALKAIALIHEYQGKKDEAIEAYKGVLEAEPDDVSVRNHLIQLYLDKKMIAEAKAELNVLAQQQPENLTARLRLGLIHFQEEEYEQAEGVLKSLAHDVPDADRVHYYLGVVYEKRGKSSQATTQFEAVKPGSDVYADAQIALAFLKEVKGDLAGSEKILRNAIEKQPTVSAPYPVLGNVLLRQKRGDEAITLLRDAALKFPKDETVWYALGETYERTKQLAKADECMHKVLEINPDNASALNYLGYMYAEQGINLAQAETLIKRALDVKPKDGFITDSLGWVYFKMERFADAVKTLEEAVALIPDEPVIMEHYADALLKVGQVARAKQIYERVVELTKENDDKQRVSEKLQAIRIP